MSPLKISLLLRMYSQPAPNGDIPYNQAVAPAMLDALDDFRDRGLVHNDVMLGHLHRGHFSSIGADSGEPYLTPKGRALVDKLMAVEP